MTAFFIFVGIGLLVLLASTEEIVKNWQNGRIEIQRLKTEEARELRLRAEIERGIPQSEPTAWSAEM